MEVPVQLDIQARGFSLTEFLLAAVEQRAEDFKAAFPHLKPAIQVRLFDINGTRGGADKGCLLHARLGSGRRSVVVTDVDRDLYVAIGGAFARLDRAVRSQLGRNERLRRPPLSTTHASMEIDR
jgi:ribosome-associated translation inhibitor RaiA